MPKAPGWSKRSDSGSSQSSNYNSVISGNLRLYVKKSLNTPPRVNELMVAFIGHRSPIGFTGGIPTWTLITRLKSPLSTVHLEIYWKYALALEPAYYDVAIPGTPPQAMGSIEIYPGGSLTPADLVVAQTIRANPAGTRLMTPSLDITIEHALLLFFMVSSASADYQSPGQEIRTVVDPSDPLLQPYDDPIARRPTLWQGSSTSAGEPGEQEIAGQWTWLLKITPGPTGETRFGVVTMGDTVAAFIAFRPDTTSETPGTRGYLTARHMPTHVFGPRQGNWLGSMRGPGNQPLDHVWLLSQWRPGGGQQAYAPMRVNHSGDYLWGRWMTPALTAQTLGGTFSLRVTTRYEPGANAPVTTMQLRLHLYITQGDTTLPRATLIDRYVDAQTWPVNTEKWFTLTAPLALPGEACQAGDHLMLELGAHVVSQPYTVPTASVTAHLTRGIGGYATSYYGSYYAISSPGPVDWDMGWDPGWDIGMVPYVEFSQTLIEAAPTLPIPTHLSCATAQSIASLPFADGPIDTTRVLSSSRQVWYKWVADTPTKVFLHTFGSNYHTTIDVYGSCSEPPSPLPSGDGKEISWHSNPSDMHDCVSLSCVIVTPVVGKTYYFRIKAFGTSQNAPAGGGALRVVMARRIPVARGDVITVSEATILRYTAAGALADLDAYYATDFYTGLAIDYTKRPILDWDEELHTEYRLLVCTRYDVYMLDLETLQTVDTLSYVYSYDQYPVNSLACSPEGKLYAGSLGDMETWRVGSSLYFYTGNLTGAIGDDGAVTVTDTTHGDNAVEEPPPAELAQVPYEKGGSNWIALNADASQLFYTSNGHQMPIGGQRILRWDIAAEVPLGDFVTVPTGPGDNPGVKGLTVLRDGRVLVCNGAEVVGYDAAGALIRHYLPPAQPYSQSFVDVKADPDELTCWALEQEMVTLFHWDLATGALLHTVPTRCGSNYCTSLVIVDPQLPPPPPPPPRVCAADFPID